METTFKKLSNEVLNAMNTKSLLAYFRAERGRMFKHFGNILCDCGCEMLIWDASEGYETTKLYYEEWNTYLGEIKLILSGRDNVETKTGELIHFPKSKMVHFHGVKK